MQLFTVNWDVEMFCWIVKYSRRCAPVSNLFFAPEYQHSREIEPVLTTDKMTWGRTVSCENNFFVQNRSINVHNMETWQKWTPFSQNMSQWLLLKELHYSSFQWILQKFLEWPIYTISLDVCKTLRSICDAIFATNYQKIIATL